MPTRRPGTDHAGATWESELNKEKEERRRFVESRLSEKIAP